MLAKPSLKHLIIGLSNLVLFALIVHWVRVNIDMDRLSVVITDISLNTLFITVALGLILIFAYGQRLTYILNKPIRPCLELVAVTFGLNNVLPFRLGDGVALAYAKAAHEIPVVTLGLAKVTEKYFDLVFVAVFGAGAILLGGMSSSLAGEVGFIIAALSLLFLLVVVCRRLLDKESRLTSWVDQSRIGKHVRKSVIAQVANLKVPQTVFWSLLIWTLTTLLMLSFFKMALPDYHFSMTDGLVLVFLTTLSLGIPSSPGAVGLFEGAIVFYLTTIKGVQAEQALGLALMLHMTMAFPQIVLAASVVLRQRYLSRKEKVALQEG